MNIIFPLNIIKLSPSLLPRLYEVPILVYHSISVNHKDRFHLDKFKQHLGFFRKNKYRVISLKELTDNLIRGSKKPHGNSVCLTFDDGYADFFINVWPLIKYYHFPATVFVIVKRIGEIGYLNFSHLKEMLPGGLLSVGSHTLGHRYLLGLNERQLKIEIEDSKKILEVNLGCPIDWFSYPWGGFSPCIQDTVRKAGYKAAFTTNQGIIRTHRHRDLYALKRLTMADSDSFLRFMIKVSGLGYCFSRKIKQGI